MFGVFFFWYVMVLASRCTNSHQWAIKRSFFPLSHTHSQSVSINFSRINEFTYAPKKSLDTDEMELYPWGKKHRESINKTRKCIIDFNLKMMFVVGAFIVAVWILIPTRNKQPNWITNRWCAFE